MGADISINKNATSQVVNPENSIQFNDFDSIKVGLCSPDDVYSWSYGEVKKPETINYRTQKPEKDGLFCERIFGPQRDWECHCGKYKRIRYKGVVCDKCGVEVTKSKVRRERMGHITLATPVSHIWYFKGIPSKMGLLLDISPKHLENVLYFASYIVTEVKSSKVDLKVNQVLNEAEYREAKDKYGDKFEAGMGAEAVRKLLMNLDLNELSKELKKSIEKTNMQGQKRTKLNKRLEAVESFRLSGNKPEWMILTVLPVIPPDLRPMVQLDGGRFAASDLNDLYRRVINRNNRLKKLLELSAPDIIVRNEKRMLQEAVDALIDNGRRGKPVTGPGNRPLKSLSDLLKGKQGRFRQNLLGKRVDYSGRSVIVVGPELKIYQCGLPKEMALELFKPFVMKKLHDSGKAHNIKSAKRMVERVKDEVWDVLAEVIKEHPVLLNRAPTLHRLGIQAFEPVLVEGRAIRLHPLVCTAYNADFDGDQMAVHVPLSAEAQAEARFLMLSANNLLKPQDGKPVTVPTQDMILGSYYLTIQIDDELGNGKIFSDVDDARLAYENKIIGLHAPIKVRVSKTDEKTGEVASGFIDTTVGRLIFNSYIPQDLGFVDRTKPENILKPEIEFKVGKKQLGQIIEKCIEIHGITDTAEVLDAIKANGYRYSTRGAITVSISDMKVPTVKKKYISETEKEIKRVEALYNRGILTDDDRYNAVIKLWSATIDKVTDALMDDDNLTETNPIRMMADSGARGSKNQIRQLAGMRGLMADTQGNTVELPIKSNFREGLNVLEYFISSHGARKGLADTALRTADSGYLTRRLVDVSQDVIIKEMDADSHHRHDTDSDIIDLNDCGTKDGLRVEGIEGIEPLSERLIGRYPLDPVIHPETGEVLCDTDTIIDIKLAKKIEESGIESVVIRSVLGCDAKVGVCAKCYGADLASGDYKHPIAPGVSVGIIAAQSIGEPGTQLTMRTFHTGGVAGGDITQGLPRVEELFEARKPKGCAEVSEISGTVTINTDQNNREVTVTSEDGEVKIYKPSYASKIIVGDKIEAGDPITEGPLNPHDILRLKGKFKVWEYMISEVQKVYRLQGVEINDKHIEVIVRQMMRKFKIEDSGDTKLLTDSYADMVELKSENQKIEDYNKKLKEEYNVDPSMFTKEWIIDTVANWELVDAGIDAEAKGLVTEIKSIGENAWSAAVVDDETGEVNAVSFSLDDEGKLKSFVCDCAEEGDNEPCSHLSALFEALRAKKPAEGVTTLLGITKAALATDSFLSAASFQETTKVLTDAAIKGKIDPLNGLKENVIIGKLIPAGTGMELYQKTHVEEAKEPVSEAESAANE